MAGLGLLDVLQGNSTPDQDQMATAVAQGLLSANGSQGLGNAMGLLNASKMDILKQRDLAQQIQLRNIGLQQQQQEFALQLPIMQRIAARMNGGQTSPATETPAVPATPAISASPGGVLGSGTFGIPIGGQPGTQSAAAPTRSAASTIAPGVSDDQLGMNIAFGGFKSIPALINQYNSPTDLMKTLAGSGLQPGSPEYTKALQDSVSKANYIAPVNARPGSILRDPRTGQPFAFNPHVPDGFAPSFDASGNVISLNPISGALPAIGAAAAAKTGGEGSVLPYSGVDAQGRPLPVTNRTAAATQGQLGAPTAAPVVDDPNIPPSTPYQRAGSDVASIQREIDGVNRSMVPAATKRMQLDILNQELTKAQAGAQAPAATPAAAPSAVYAAPPMGAAPAADVSQKAPAHTMQESYTKLQTNGGTANAALDALDKMMGLAAKKNPLLTAGVLGTNQSAVNPDAAEYEKQRANVISLLAQQGGTNGTDAGRALTGESVPDFGKPKAAINDGLATLRNQVVAMQLKRDFLTPVYQAGDSKRYTTLENEFDQNVSPALVPLLTMQPGPKRAAELKAAAQNPTLKARLNWAAENGLLK